MRVLRFPRPKRDKPVPWAVNTAFSLAADRHVVVTHGRALHIYDLHAPDDPVARIPDVVDHSLTSACLVTVDAQGLFTRWEPREGPTTSWEPISSFPMPRTPGASSSLPELLLVSRSGRYVLVESAPIARERAGPGAWVYLLDAETGEVRRAFEMDATGVRAGFARLPSGVDVLFVSAENDMCVQMVACATGETLNAYLHVFGVEHEEEFCHTDYALTADATRLLTFGCNWAAPYEVRIYDATPWTRPRRVTPGVTAAPYVSAGATAAPPRTFPLPLIYRQIELFGANHVSLLPFEPQQRDGTVTSVALADLARLSATGAPEAAERVRKLSEPDRAIYRQLSRLPRIGTGVIIRRINPTSGQVVGWSVVATAKTAEQHVHVLTDHRVLLVNDRIQVVNGMTGEVRDKGPSDATMRERYTQPTTSGDILLVY